MARSSKFTEWEWRDPETRELIKIECRCEKDRDKVDFFVRDEKRRLNMSNADPNKLKDEVFSELTARRVVEWTHHLHVFVGGDGSWEISSDHFVEEDGEHVSLSQSLHVAVHPVQTAVRGDGKKVWNSRGGYGGNISFGEPHVGHGELSVRVGDRTTGYWSLVPDTPENRRALRTIIDNMALMKTRLSKLLSPDNLQASLDAVAAGGLADLGQKVGQLGVVSAHCLSLL